jgi:signal transduction histidine kinase
MKPRQTLRRKLGRLTAMIVFAVGAFAFLISAADSYFHLRFKRTALAAALLNSAKSQNDLLVPTFLLPEQERGRKLVIERIARDDDLVTAQIVHVASELPPEFRDCTLISSGSSCMNADRKTLATLTPIGEPGQIFGYLLKIRRIDSALSGEQSLYAAGSVALALLLTFSLLIFWISKITSREVPRELDALVDWVEAFLANRHTKKVPELNFEELSRLGARIGELIEQHERDRDQAVVGLLTTGIMHDIRTPLQSVVTALELIGEARTSSKRAELLENLYHCCSVKIPIVGQIIETTLDVNRNIHIEKTSSDVKEALTKAISLQAELAQGKKVSVEIALPESPIIVPHDPAQMIRVFSNLIKNGIEATTEGVAPRKVLISSQIGKSAETILTIEDSGPGISGDPTRLFRIFQSKKRHGSGLGLLVSRKIMEAHGGNLDATPSRALPGASFVVKFATDYDGQKMNITEGATV